MTTINAENPQVALAKAQAKLAADKQPKRLRTSLRPIK